MEKMYFEKEFDFLVDGVKFTATATNFNHLEESLIKCNETLYVCVFHATNKVNEFYIKPHQIDWANILNKNELYLKVYNMIEENIKAFMKEDLEFSTDDVVEKELALLEKDLTNLIQSIKIKKPKYALQDARAFFNKNASYLRNTEIFKLIDDLDLNDLNEEHVRFWSE